jgi:hypothetical protein
MASPYLDLLKTFSLISKAVSPSMLKKGDELQPISDKAKPTIFASDFWEFRLKGLDSSCNCKQKLMSQMSPITSHSHATAGTRQPGTLL